jgi:thioredoxin-like negative regulator of GroEL
MDPTRFDVFFFFLMNTNHDNAMDSEEELFLELEKEDDSMMASIRETRIAQLKHQFANRKPVRHGTYETFKNEKDLMLMTTKTKKVVIHFGKPDFKRCRIMDEHLERLARKHTDTKFVRVDVENVPFLVTKMEIQVLPCIVSFIDGVGTDRLLGFEGVAEMDRFPTLALEKRLALTSIILSCRSH